MITFYCSIPLSICIKIWPNSKSRQTHNLHCHPIQHGTRSKNFNKRKFHFFVAIMGADTPTHSGSLHHMNVRRQHSGCMHDRGTVAHCFTWVLDNSTVAACTTVTPWVTDSHGCCWTTAQWLHARQRHLGPLHHM